MTNEEQERLLDEAWQRMWSDHLRNQEDIPISKHSFYMGFREAMKICAESNQFLEKEYKSLFKEKIGDERRFDKWIDRVDCMIKSIEKMQDNLRETYDLDEYLIDSKKGE